MHRWLIGYIDEILTFNYESTTISNTINTNDFQSNEVPYSDLVDTQGYLLIGSYYPIRAIKSYAP
jgi:hypothetical protein